MCPSDEQFVPFMLQFVLSASEEVAELVLDRGGIAVVLRHLDERLVQVIGHESQWFWMRRLTNRSHELVSELILNPWLLQKRTAGLQVENPPIFLG